MSLYLALLHDLLPKCTQITELKLTGHHFADHHVAQAKLFECVPQLPQLSKLALHVFNHASRAAFAQHFQGWTSLTDLTLYMDWEKDGSWYMDDIPLETAKEMAATLSSFPNLIRLTIDSTLFIPHTFPPEQLADYLVRCQNLQYLSLSRLPMPRVNTVKLICQLPNLQEFVATEGKPHSLGNVAEAYIAGQKLANCQHLTALNCEWLHYLLTPVLQHTPLWKLPHMRSIPESTPRVLRNNRAKHITLQSLANYGNELRESNTFQLTWPYHSSPRS